MWEILHNMFSKLVSSLYGLLMDAWNWIADTLLWLFDATVGWLMSQLFPEEFQALMSPDSALWVDQGGTGALAMLVDAYLMSNFVFNWPATLGIVVVAAGAVLTIRLVRWVAAFVPFVNLG